MQPGTEAPPLWQTHFDTVAAQEGIYLYRHKANGLRVALVPLPANDVAALSIVFMVGSKAEVTGMTGSAHILEHELFKKFPGFDIWHELGDHGARINASTSTDRTEFHEEVGTQDVKTALTLEARRMRSAPLTGLQTEKTVVRNEFERGKNNPSTYHREIVYIVALLQGSPIGTAHDIMAILQNRDRLSEFKNEFYCCANAAIVLSGTFDPDDVLNHVHEEFGDMEAGESTRDGSGRDQAAPTLPQKGMRSVDTPGEMPLATLSFRVGDGVSREAVAMELVALWFSSGPDGAFQDVLRDDPELHGVQADYDRAHGESLFILWIIPVSGGDARKRVDRLLGEMMSKLRGPCFMTEEALSNMKTTLSQRWRMETESISGFTASVVESFARADTPFDVVQRHHVLGGIELADVKRAWSDVFVEHRMTVGRVLPDLSSIEVWEPKVTPYDVSGGEYRPIRPARSQAPPFERAVVTPSGVYLADDRSSQVCVRVHVPISDGRNTEASVRASLATLGVKSNEGQVLNERKLHREFTSRGASASVKGDHSGINVRLDVHATEDVERLVRFLKAGVDEPFVTETEFDRKKHFLSEIAVGCDYDVSESAKRLFSRCLYHHESDPRRLLTGREEGDRLRRMSMEAVKKGMHCVIGDGAWVTCVAPTPAHCRLVREVFETESRASHDASLGPPGAGPHAGRVVTLPLPGKTSATMLLGCACGIGVADDEALPLSLAVDALGGAGVFTARLMNEIREKRGLTYGISAGTFPSDPKTTTLYVNGTFAPSLLQQGVKLSRDLVRAWLEQGIEQEELDRAKTRFVGSTQIAWNNPCNLADALHSARVHFQSPAARCSSFADRVRAVSLEDCREALKALPPFDEWVCVCAGAIPTDHTM